LPSIPLYVSDCNYYTTSHCEEAAPYFTIEHISNALGPVFTAV
jgi:hypothetical protein